MATFKHISSKNADYGAAEQYLTFEHDEFTMKPTLDENGRLVPREDYRLATLNCGDEDFAVACMRSNLRYGKNQKREDVKSHHYIISFDPRDGTDNGLTVDKAQSLGEEFCKEHFPGHQAIVCTHPDGHNHSGNIHVHIVINSLRIEAVPLLPYMDRPADTKDGCKHRCTDAAMEYFKSEVMEMCHRENLYQIDLLHGSKNRITEREYWAQKKGQLALDAKLHAIDPDDPEQANRPDSRTREVQAESVAYTVCQHYGLDTSEYSFGYVAGWSSGRELAELKASLEVIRSTAHELISALDEHLAELRQQREADLSAAQETAFVLDSGNTLFIQTCDSGYDYTLYGPDHTALDGGQLDAPGLTLPDAGQEALNLLGQTAAVSEVLLGDKLAAFQEAAEKANEIPTPIKIPDPAAEPTVTVLWSESDKLQDGEIMPLSVANRVFEKLDTAQHTDREKDGYTGGWYDKTAFRIDFTLNGQPDNYEGRQDFGDGEGSLVQHIQNYHEYYAKDENWKNFVLHNKGPEAWEQDKAEREMVLTEFIPYLKQHCNLSAMEQTAATALQEGQNISPEQAAYYNAVVAYVQDCRPLLNQGQYDLPEPPKLADFDQTLQDYKAQVQAEIAQEAADAGMTVEEYAAAGFEAPQQDSFSIYQLRNEDSTRDYRFEPYDRLQAAGLSVDKANYTEVYAAPLAAGTTLEDLYRTFNVDHPADFKGHSLSVSDVVVLHQNGQDTAHYCDSVGFQQVPEFLRENPLRTAELSTEQNENMIDGVLNNTPSLGELEAKAKAGEQISLTDLAAAVKAEEKAPKAKKSHTAKPKKPSIRAQLDAAKKEQSKQTPPREKTKELEV